MAPLISPILRDDPSIRFIASAALRTVSIPLAEIFRAVATAALASRAPSAVFVTRDVISFSAAADSSRLEA